MPPITMDSREDRSPRRKALVVGRIGLVRSLGRERIPVTLAREGTMVFERASRYCREFVFLPNLDSRPNEALDVLERFGAQQEEKPVAFFNGESEVLLFSKHRRRLGKYFEIVLAPHDLVAGLIDKGRFAELARRHGLPVPKTVIPRSPEECLSAAEEIGYPCIIKPIRQRRWHGPAFLDSIGKRKALLVSSPDELSEALKRLPTLDGGEMIQQYIPGADGQHFDFHAYLDREGNVRGALAGQKIRTYPVHFGQGCYTQFVDEPRIKATCLESLKKIGYIGAANINLKRHAETGEDYILEINPRYSLWTVLDSCCGVNLPLLQYREATGRDVPTLKPTGLPRRWLWLGADVNALRAYRKHGELSCRQWLQSFFTHRGKIEFHVFAWDDPLPVIASWGIGLYRFLSRIPGYLKRRIAPLRTLLRRRLSVRRSQA